MRENLRAVNPLPPKRIIGKLIVLVPADLCRHKVFHTRFFHDLGHRSRIAEHIRQPYQCRFPAKLLANKAFPVHKLSDERFS